MTAFMDSLCEFVQTGTIDRCALREARTAVADTVAVSLAGWYEPSSQAVRRAYGASEDPRYGRSGLDIEHEALVHGTTAHSLDYDDVQLTSVTHPSAVAVPPLLAIAAREPQVRPRVLPALAIGNAVNAALGDAFGFNHYDRGWHATSTIGPIAAVASICHLFERDEATLRNALALAAAQCGGLQRNFGTLSKPVHAGFAAAAAVRAARLAQSGVTGAHDVFGPRGYFDLYGDPETALRAAKVRFPIDKRLISRKLYPCCYATHRMIGAAIAAHRQVGDTLPYNARITLDVPYGTMRPLQIIDPKNGNEAKFCATYVTAVALQQGRVVLSDFTADAIDRVTIRDMMARITVIEEPLETTTPAGLNNGAVTLSILAGNKLIDQQVCDAYPGSPEAPATDQQMIDKFRDCLEVYGRAAPSITYAEFEAGVDELTR
ncbi:MmgE/PrpD family protein [Tsuneonella rigui]|uniref:MmgE/PrpD family protein n=1 Tax=Tsuneonella rigui TaxID=1708790 RepID=UPI000F7F99E1|nr:MmgE/PrpD family protein [Tsuneonella rigui]